MAKAAEKTPEAQPTPAVDDQVAELQRTVLQLDFAISVVKETQKVIDSQVAGYVERRTIAKLQLKGLMGEGAEA